MAERSPKLAGVVAEQESGRTQDEHAREDPTGASENRRTFTPWQRVQIFVATWIGYFAVLLIGRTLRWEVEGWDNFEAALQLGVAYAALQCADLLRNGAPGVHFYTLNRSSATRAILAALRAQEPWREA